MTLQDLLKDEKASEEIESLLEKLPLNEEELEEINDGAYEIDIRPTRFPQKLMKLLLTSKNKTLI